MTSPETVEAGEQTLSSDFRQQRKDLEMTPKKLRDFQSFLENKCVCYDIFLTYAALTYPFTY